MRNPYLAQISIVGLLLAVFMFAPQAAKATDPCSTATNWAVSLGAQSPDAAKQAMAFLPNEIWIDAGDCVTWTSQTGEIHTVTFLQQPETPATPGNFSSTAVVRPSFQPPPPAFGCAGGNQGGANPTTSNPSVYDGASTSCVNSGPYCDDSLQQPAGTDPCASKTFTVQFTNPGNYKLVCLVHSDMTGAVHVLATDSVLPHKQEFYDDEARDQAYDLVHDTDSPREELGDFQRSAHEVIMTGELAATAGGKQYLAIMRYFPTTITVEKGDTVEWVNLSPDEPHTVTFVPAGGMEPVPVLTPGGTRNPTYSSVDGALPDAVQPLCGGVANCFNSGLIGPANQDQTGLPQTPIGITRVRVTFNAEGEYDYFCILHDDLGMRGHVKVVAPHPGHH